MNTSDVKEQLQQYNKTLHGTTNIEKRIIMEVDKPYTQLNFSYLGGVDTFHVDDFIKNNKNFQGLLKDNAEELVFYLRNIQKYTCNTGNIRMDIRSNDFSKYEHKVLDAIGAFYIFYGTNMSLKDLIYGEYRQLPSHYQLHCVIASKLLIEDKEVIGYCKDVLLSENNTAVLTREVIVAIEQSNNKELQTMLTQVLLAAKLQEGLRQAILESVDENDVSYFLEMIQVIRENNLLRFVSVQRAVMTWIGIGYNEVKEKEVQRLLDTISLYVNDETSRKQALGDTNPLFVYLALYVKGIFSFEEALEEAFILLQQRERQIVAVALIYIQLSCQFDVLKHIDMLDTYKDDPWIIGLYLSHCYAQDIEKKQITTRDVQLLMQKLSSLVKTMKTTTIYQSKGFEWFQVSVDKGTLVLFMYEVMRKSPTQENIDLLMPFISLIMQYYKADEFMNHYFDRASLSLRMQALEQGIVAANKRFADRAAKKYKEMHMTEKEILFLEQKLTTKKTYNQALIVDILANQKKTLIKESYERLSTSSNEIIQKAALELKNKASHVFSEYTPNTLLGRSDGYGLYMPRKIYEVPYKNTLISKKEGLLKNKIVVDLDNIFVWDKKMVMDYLQLWSTRLVEHENDEFYNGREYCQLKDNAYALSLTYKRDSLDDLALANIWRSYFEKDELSADVLYELNFLTVKNDNKFIVDNHFSAKSSFFSLSYQELSGSNNPYIRQIEIIINCYYNEIKDAENQKKDYQLLQFMNEYLNIKEYPKKDYNNKNILVSLGEKISSCFTDFLTFYSSDEEFKERFPLVYLSYVNFNLLGRDDAQNKYTIHPWHVARAYYLGMIEKDALYECILDTHLVNGSFWHTNNDTRLQQAYAIAYFQNHYQKVPTIDLRGYKVEGKEVDTKVIMILREALEDIVNTLLKIEQQRLIEKSEATPYLLQNKVFPGIKYLVLALKEIATSTITRGNDTYSRTAIFVEVIKHSYPLASDTSALLAKANIREERLVEVAMLAPQWIDIISEVIKWDGFKEACYYFIAHIKDYNNEEKKAEIAHYTALDPSDLNDGAFDREWCKEVYATLGKQRFKLIYQAAKFLCDNAFHARARKYADACMGNIAKEELLKQVQEKRNKDSLNAYCICEIKDDKDLLERYMVVQKFAKEAKQFGAQRRASEKRASDIAMLNLARNSRFESVTRLQWFLEKEMISQVADVLEPNKIEDIEIWIAFDAEGKNEVKVSKAGKALKAVPARLKKQVDVIRILDIHKQWNEQYKRSRMMLEKAMNERSVFSKEEITMMMDNPIAAPMMKKLVLKSGQSVGFYKGTNGYTLLLTDEVYIAHPYDLYQMGVWQDYQTYIFEQQLVQPFKQVFRELYLKLEEELEFTFTRRYSGYQIQTKKAATTLRTRGWNADYENGLEKVDYRFNTVVNLYANADWFSPNDIEAPSIDYVGFHERLKRDSMKVKNVDDVTFSEAMRDVDLAISTAYVGGVDPLTTTSTIAMRKAIVTYTLKLMNIDTVEVQDNFANIKGHLNNYSVHLGSGMVHQSGGAAIHMIPIFNGKRGNVYLPFLDEDPKTAEIVSKIIMLAEDNKIKDVSILKQIKS